MNRTTESSLALALGISRAYQPFLSDAESEALRLEVERRDALVDAWHEGHREQRRYRGRSAVVAWLVVSWLVGFVGGLTWLVWGAL
jgi:hypothetical protein